MLTSLTRPRNIALVAAAAIGLYLAYAATVAMPASGVRFDADPGTWRGAFHVHTNASDGTGRLEDVAAAARAAGAAWVVVADHNILPPQRYRRIDGVLVVFAPEVSATDGHVTTIGLTRLPTRPERKAPDALANLRRLGGAPVASHPLGRKRPYTRLDDPGLAGMEVLSADQEFREALVAPHRLAPALLAYPVNPAYAVARLIRRSAPTFDRWDALLRTRRFPGFCAIDAHGRPGYSLMMTLLGMYAVIGRPPTGNPEADGPALEAALLQGRTYCGVDLLGGAGGFRFGATAPGATAGPGDEVALADQPILRLDLAYSALPPDARASLVCRGRDVPLTEVPVARGRRYEARPPEAGACRAEVRLGRAADPGARPWIVSNPIYVR